MKKLRPVKVKSGPQDWSVVEPDSTWWSNPEFMCWLLISTFVFLPSASPRPIQSPLAAARGIFGNCSSGHVLPQPQTSQWLSTPMGSSVSSSVRLRFTASTASSPVTENNPSSHSPSHIPAHSQHPEGRHARPPFCDFNSCYCLTAYIFFSSSLGELLHILQYPAQMSLCGRLSYLPQVEIVIV